MTSSLFSEILQSITLLSLLLLVGVFLIAKIKLLRYFYLPASVVGGFIGLCVVQSNIFSIPSAWITIYSLLPGVLIIPIFASIPLGMNMGKNGIRSFFAPNIIKSFGVFMTASMFQFVIGYGVNIVFSKIDPEINLYRTFGYELWAGFSGGHAMASSLGILLEGFGMSRWELAQGVALTMATVGLMGGIVFGIVFINIHIRKQNKTGENTLRIKTAMKVEEPFYRNIDEQESVGRQAFRSNVIETTTFHFALIFVVCGASYMLLSLLGKTNISAFRYLPVWTYSMVIMLFVNIIIQKSQFDWAIDYKLKSGLIGLLADFAIISAIVSLPIKAVLQYSFPLLVMIILGFVCTYFIIFQLSKVVFKDYSFERSIIAWGTATGVLITGMTLLKIYDSEYKTPALKDFSLGFSLMSITNLLATPLINMVLATGSTMQNMMFTAGLSLFYMSIAFIFNLKCFRK